MPKEIVIACEVCRTVFRGDPNTAVSRGWTKTHPTVPGSRWRCPEHPPDAATK
ncbi:MAG TPA: hypothetical protein VGI39_01455 [Polyangiaceae bacterium]|jgi:hypothetical protein